MNTRIWEIARLRAFVAVLFVVFHWTVSVGEPASEESGFYAFESGRILVSYKSGFLPVLSADKKGIYIETERGLKKVRYSTPCRLFPHTAISDEIVGISEIEFGFDNLKQARLESSAVTDMMMAEAGTEMAIVLKGGSVSGVPSASLSEETAAEIKDLRDRQELDNETMQRSLEEDAYSRGELSDLINVKFRLQSETDLVNVYCAMVVRYVQSGFDGSKELRKAAVVRMKRVGDLDEGIPEKVKFTYPLAEGFVNEAGIDILLFHGESQPLATNLSRGLRSLTVEELEKLQGVK